MKQLFNSKKWYRKYSQWDDTDCVNGLKAIKSQLELTNYSKLIMNLFLDLGNISGDFLFVS